MSQRLKSLAVSCLVALCSLGGCEAQPVQSRPICTPEAPSCPDGLVCVGGSCIPDDGSSDLSVKPDDMQAGSADLRPTFDLFRPNGCRSGIGAPVGGYTWACPGTFAAGGARALCAAGFHVCRAAAYLTLGDCRQVNGFFLADVRGFDSGRDCTASSSAVMCGYTKGATRPLWFGCGTGRPGVQECVRGCDGFSQALNGSLVGAEPGPPFVDSLTASLNDQVNNDPLIGVLCCLD